MKRNLINEFLECFGTVTDSIGEIVDEATCDCIPVSKPTEFIVNPFPTDYFLV